MIDTTGLKVFGAGEWYVRKHGMGRGRRRTWRKLHLCVEETSKDIVVVDLITRAVHDSPHLPAVLDQVEGDVGQVSADRAYVSGTCYAAILGRDEGRYPWRTSSGATRRSLAENAVSRFKALVGVKLASRVLGRQQVEALVKRQVLNRMAALGMPRSERISVA